jgi:hypothetical protein
MDLKELRAMSLEATKQLSAILEKAYTEKEKEPSEKAKKLLALINGSGNFCSGGKRDIIGIVGELIGEKITTKSKDILLPSVLGAPKGAMILLLDNTNSHSYAIGELIAVYQGKNAVDIGGAVGNNLPHFTEENMRIATQEEVNAFYDAAEIIGASKFVKAMNLLS